MCEVIWCSRAGFTNRGQSGDSYTLGVKTMNNGWGKMTSETQGDEGSSDEGDQMAAERTAFGAVKNHLVEAGLAKLVRDSVRCVQGEKCVEVLEAKETLLKAKIQLNGGNTGGLR